MTLPSYYCARCKQPQTGDPALRNATGMYCAPCRSDITDRMIQASQKAADARRGICPWCGDAITDRNRQKSAGKDGENVCTPCTQGRVWLLKVIRHSDRAANYVAKTDEREAPLREERKRNAVEVSSVKPAAPDDRIARLEAMIEKLTTALGGVP